MYNKDICQMSLSLKHQTFKPQIHFDDSDNESETPERIMDDSRYWELRNTPRPTIPEKEEMGELKRTIKRRCSFIANKAIKFNIIDIKQIVSMYDSVPEENRSSKCLTFYQDQVIQYLNKFFAIIQGEKVEYAETYYDLERGEWHPRKYQFRDLTNFKQVLTQSVNFAPITDERKSNKIKLLDLWVNHPKHRVYEAKTFYPSLEFDKPELLNIFTGFNILESEADEQVRELWIEKAQYVGGSGGAIIDARNRWIDLHVKPWTDHILNIWCKGNTTHAEYCYNWFAHQVQHPEIKMGVVMLLRGPEGAGKGCIIQKVGNVIGPQGYKQPTDVDDCLGTFAAYMMEGACLLFMDEAVWGGNKTMSGKLKKIITEEKYYAQKKFQAVQEYQSFTNIIMASNEEWNFPAGRAARRLFALDIDERYSGTATKESDAYFAAIRNIPDMFLAQWLYTRDVSEFRPRNTPLTQTLQDQKIKSQNPLDGWWCNMLQEFPLWLTKTVSKEEVFRSFQETSRDKYKRSDEFFKDLGKMSVSVTSRESNGARRYMITFSPLEEQRAKWREYQHCPDWTFCVNEGEN